MLLPSLRHQAAAVSSLSQHRTWSSLQLARSQVNQQFRVMDKFLVKKRPAPVVGSLSESSPKKVKFADHHSVQVDQAYLVL